jgi:hypothetical protein
LSQWSWVALQKVLRMRSRLSKLKYRVTILSVLAIVVSEALFISQPCMATIEQCSAKKIENNVENLSANPALIDTLVACGSDIVPVLLRRYIVLSSSESYFPNPQSGHSTEQLKAIAEKVDYERLLVLTTLGQMGSSASLASRDLAKSLDAQDIQPFSPTDLNKVILYTLWQINGDPIRTLSQIVLDPKEDLSSRYNALNYLKDFPRNNSNFMPEIINSKSLEITTNESLTLIAINPGEDLNFRLDAFIGLRDKITAEQSIEIQNGITKTLLKIIRNQSEETEKRFDAINIYGEILGTSTKPVNEQIITSFLSQIILNKSEKVEIRYKAIDRYEYQLQNFAYASADSVSREIKLRLLKNTLNELLEVITLDSNEDLDFRLNILMDLKTKGIASKKLSKVKTAITNSLFKIIQNQSNEPENRLYAVNKIISMYIRPDGSISPIGGETLIKNPMRPADVKIIVPVLTQIALNTSNSDEIRNDALLRLYDFDNVLAAKIAKDVPKYTPTPTIIRTIPVVPEPTPLPQGGGTPTIRNATVVRLKSAPPVVCRYPVIKTIFAWKCRRLTGV